MNALTVSGVFPIGVEIDGKRHKNFTVRPGTLGDSIAAAEKINAASAEDAFAILVQGQSWTGIPPESMPDVLMGMYRNAQQAGGDTSHNVLHYATLAERVTIEGLEPEQVTLALLMGLLSRDGIALQVAVEAVEKKLEELSSN